MDSSATECSSGCESGWTAYLNRLTDSSRSSSVKDGEDLSMVSDASSRPPEKTTMKKKKKDKGGLEKDRRRDLSLDDTATSPYCKKNEEAFNEKLSKGESASKKQPFKSSTKGEIFSSMTGSCLVGKKKKH